MKGKYLLTIAAAGVASLAAQEPTYTNGIGMELVLIHPGTLQVGVFQPACPEPPQQNAAETKAPARPRPPQDPRVAWTEADYEKCRALAKQDSTPGFPVTIVKGYYIGRYEVTQGEWKKVMGSNPSVFPMDKTATDADRYPVDSVTWQDAQAFVKKLNQMEKTSEYRLPTEFEWEYAARAGGPGQTAWNEIRQMAVQGIGFGGRSATPAPPPGTRVVGSKKPNAWGLYDMLGNVWEWVGDYYNEKIFPDPTPPKSGKEHVLKGCGFTSDVKNCIPATHSAGPGDGWNVGFRVVRGARAN